MKLYRLQVKPFLRTFLIRFVKRPCCQLEKWWPSTLCSIKNKTNVSYKIKLFSFWFIRSWWHHPKDLDSIYFCNSYVEPEKLCGWKNLIPFLVWDICCWVTVTLFHLWRFFWATSGKQQKKHVHKMINHFIIRFQANVIYQIFTLGSYFFKLEIVSAIKIPKSILSPYLSDVKFIIQKRSSQKGSLLPFPKLEVSLFELTRSKPYFFWQFVPAFNFISTQICGLFNSIKHLLCPHFCLYSCYNSFHFCKFKQAAVSLSLLPVSKSFQTDSHFMFPLLCLFFRHNQVPSSI